VDAAARRLAGGPRRQVDVGSEHTRLLAVPVVLRGRRLGTVVAGASLRPFERTQRTALVASLMLAALLLVAVIVVARLTLSAALRPVERMTASADQWSEHDLDRRFRLGPARDELSHLAATLDRLLDRLAASLRREQSLTSEISHELRTPLSKVMAEAQLALRRAGPDDPAREPLERIDRAAREMKETLDVLLTAARSPGDDRTATTDVFQAASAAARAAGAPEPEVVRPAQPIRVSADPALVERILSPMIENARRHARSRVWIGIEPSGNGMVEVTVRDDGPGVAPADLDRVFEAGIASAGPDGSPPGSGAGLGLALARRLAGAAGGEVKAQAGDGGRFVVRLPAA
jgi:signal transduction histidine kinase